MFWVEGLFGRALLYGYEFPSLLRLCSWFFYGRDTLDMMMMMMFWLAVAGQVIMFSSLKCLYCTLNCVPLVGAVCKDLWLKWSLIHLLSNTFICFRLLINCQAGWWGMFISYVFVWGDIFKCSPLMFFWVSFFICPWALISVCALKFLNLLFIFLCVYLGKNHVSKDVR